MAAGTAFLDDSSSTILSVLLNKVPLRLYLWQARL